MVPTISVVIPAFNEEKTIEVILSRTLKTLEAIQFPFEVIVVDDGSIDKTAHLAYQSKVTVLVNGENQGKGHALQKGFRHAKGDILITMDADGSHRPEDLRKLVVPLLNGADVVFGSRFIDKGESNATKKLHLFGNRLFNLLIRLLTKKRITDSQTGFRGYKKKIIEQIEITSYGYDVETELTVKSLKNGYVVVEEPITFEKRKDGISHLHPLNDGFKILKAILLAALKPEKQIKGKALSS